MRPFPTALAICWIGSWLPAPAPAQGTGLAAIIASVQDADYRGDLGRLRSLADSMTPYLADPVLARRARYWRGFAHWRHALNRLNDGGTPDSVDADFAAAIAEFREALRLDPADVEARIGLAAGLGNRAYFNRGKPEAAGFLAELRVLLETLSKTAPDNPRMIFVAAPSRFWPPPDRGGDRQAALAMLERGIALTAGQPRGADVLAPSWGEAELHMLLAWFSTNLAPPDGTRAVEHAEAALALRPDWRYVRDTLLPRARAAGGALH